MESTKLIKNVKSGIVLHQYKAVYWWVPKNACTSFKAMLGQAIGVIDPMNVHASAFEFTDDFNSFPDYYHFAVVRNPEDRFYSLWANKIQPAEFTNHNFTKGVHYIFERYGDKFYGGMSFEDFQEAVLSIPHEDADCHFLPQSFQIPDSNVHIMRLESIDQEVQELLKTLGIENARLSHKNRSRIPDYKEMPIFTEAFYDYYSSDYSTFNYIKS